MEKNPTPQEQKDHQCHCCGNCNCKPQEKPFVSGAEDMTLTTSDKAKIDEYHRKTS